MVHARTKRQRLELAKRLFFTHYETGIGDAQLARELGVAYNSAFRYRKELGAVEARRARFRLIPTKEDIELARAVLQAARRAGLYPDPSLPGIEDDDGDCEPA
jgi:hypothetical protein